MTSVESYDVAWVRVLSSSIRMMEGYVLFNDALNTCYLRLHGVGHIVKDFRYIERKTAAATWATLSD